ncbi:TetR/AcrR family transcriptional regulator [Achromobacter ruhlandii]|uniref:TetR/AcrR family transcriptional regulator n=1 Tax=Achromobacter ruhlandii TaxID=72557 RepID=UPI001466F1BA|nr:TetR/AcrR family transcriptional regulator [Achromobacter ruhlandii]CAB3923510.1 hypothetical protein LMG1864_05602 [Achromobacter ruhlandii]
MKGFPLAMARSAKSPGKPDAKPGAEPGARPDTRPADKPDSRPAGKPDTRRGAHARAATPRTKPAPVRLDELMAAAEDLFVRQGVEATTIDQIVAQAGVAKGTFYHYFSSKADVLAALRVKFSQGFLDRIDAAMAACAPDDGVARLQAWTRAGVQAYFDGYALHDVVFHDVNHPHRGAAERAAVLAQAEAMLRAGQQAGCWRLAQPALTAILLYHGMHGAVDDAIARGAADADALAASLIPPFLRLVGAPTAA